MENHEKNLLGRCNLTERHIGQIERGEFLIGLPTLNKIISGTGVDADYILYGKGENKNFKIKNILNSIIDKSNKTEIRMYYQIIIAIKNYTTKKSNK